MLKVMTIVGTRPELIKMSRVIAEFDQYTKHVLVHTGQNYDYELNQVFFEDLDIRKPDYFLNAVGSNAVKTIARIIESVDDVLEKETPQAILFYGDTNSTLAVIAAKRRKIPIFHMEAGNRCFDERVPEEINRRILDHLSDINLVLTERSRAYLIAEGIKAETIIKTGSHLFEVLEFFKEKIATSNILKTLNLSSERFFIVSIHREENVDTPENLQDLLNTFNALATAYDVPIIVSTHPRTQSRINALAIKGLSEHIRFLKPFGFSDYIRLQQEALCVISDSGTITEEASLLNLPAIMVRNAHERPEGMDAGTLIMAGLKQANILDAVRITLAQHDRSNRVARPITDYENPAVSKQILRVVLSYVGYINRTVWRKNV